MRWKVPTPTTVFEVTAADGYRLTVRRHGDPRGTRLLLSHGNGFAIDAYYPFWSRLTDRFDCFIHDVRNHGWNPIDGGHLKHNIPFFVNDGKRIVREIEERFGVKPTIGVFHSLTAIVALHQATAGDSFAALVLFDPPLYPAGGLLGDLQGIGSHMGATTRKRQARFDSPGALVASLRKNPAFQRVTPEVLCLFARTTLRRTADAEDYELRCPREYEAQIFEHLFSWAMTAELAEVRCPVKVIGSDPTCAYSFMPSIKLEEIVSIDYDFVPETTHLLQLEEPETCVALLVEFLEELGLAAGGPVVGEKDAGR